MTPITEYRRVSSFVVMGEPHAKERVRKGKHGTLYTPQTTRDAEARLSQAYKLQNTRRRYDRFGIAVSFRFFRSTVTRMDLDNLIKLAQDAGNNILWSDDSMVTRYLDCYQSTNDLRPRTELDVFVPSDWLGSRR